MRIRMKTLAAGPDRTLVPDQVYVLPTSEARELVEGGYALEVDRHGEPLPDQPRRHPTPQPAAAGAGQLDAEAVLPDLAQYVAERLQLDTTVADALLSQLQTWYEALPERLHQPAVSDDSATSADGDQAAAAAEPTDGEPWPDVAGGTPDDPGSTQQPAPPASDATAPAEVVVPRQRGGRRPRPS